MANAWSRTKPWRTQRWKTWTVLTCISTIDMYLSPSDTFHAQHETQGPLDGVPERLTNRRLEGLETWLLQYALVEELQSVPACCE